MVWRADEPPQLVGWGHEEAAYDGEALAGIGGMLADRFDAHELVATLRTTAQQVATELCGGAVVAVRTTHAYPDGVAPYLTVIAPRRGGTELSGSDRGRAQASAWDEVKVAVSEVIDAASATITHHHAVGRYHRPWYDRQRPEPFARALRAARSELDPAGILNPGVLTDPVTRTGSTA